MEERFQIDQMHTDGPAPDGTGPSCPHIHVSLPTGTVLRNGVAMIPGSPKDGLLNCMDETKRLLVRRDDNTLTSEEVHALLYLEKALRRVFNSDEAKQWL